MIGPDYYAAPITKKAPLTRAAECALFSTYRKRRTAKLRRQIVEQYLYWATEMANRYSGPRISKPDAISAANLGLMRAIEKFDPACGKSFVFWSFLSIRRNIIDFVRTDSFAVNPFPAMKAAHYVYKKAGKTAAAKQQWRADTQQILDAVDSPASLSARRVSGEEIIPVPTDPREERDSVETSSALESIRANLHLLNRQERRIVQLRYFGTDTLIFRDIGKKMRIAEDHVRYVHDRAVRKLRELFKKEN